MSCKVDRRSNRRVANKRSDDTLRRASRTHRTSWETPATWTCAVGRGDARVAGSLDGLPIGLEGQLMGN